MATNTVQNKGIYHNLPSYSEDVNGLTAIITGANGISGFHTMRVLLASPERWKKVYALSRRPPPADMMALIPQEAQARVQHIACDFLSSPDDIARDLSEQGLSQADYVFFYSYLQPAPDPGAAAWSNAEALVKTNSALLENFLAALEHSSITPKRFILQTGAKNYGVHLGTILQPSVESDPRVTLEPNFYYPQEDLLTQYCERAQTSWNVVRPAWIIGATTNAQMNVFHGVAVYAAVQAHLRQPLSYPGDLEYWNGVSGHSSAMLTGFLTEYLALTPHTAGQAFNAADGGLFTWSRFWPELARWFNIPVPDVVGPEPDDTLRYETYVTPGPPPLGYGTNAKFRYTFTLSEWAKRPANRAAWKEIAARHDLTHDPFDDLTVFAFADAALWGPPGRMNMSMNKARMYGWNGFVDTTEAIFDALAEMARLRMLPPMAKGEEPRAYI